MEYSINKLSRMAAISTRTLRYYDEINLLKPLRVSESGYRVYGQKQVDRLQQILFFRELGIGLEGIKDVLNAPNFDSAQVLGSHLAALLAAREQLNILIANVEKTIAAAKGEIIMSDKEKFEGFKQKLIDDNEKHYGAEIRAKYGDEAINKSNTKMKGMTPEQYVKSEKLRQEIEEALKVAFETGNPASELAQKACEFHKDWLSFFYDQYSKEYHMGLAQMYVDDPRFTQYYDRIAVGCAKFLRDAITIYCKES